MAQILRATMPTQRNDKGPFMSILGTDASASSGLTNPAHARGEAAIGPWRMAAATLGLCFMAEPISHPIATIIGNPETAGAVLRPTWLLVYAIFLPFVILDGARTMRGPVSTPLLAGLVLLAIVSVLWSASPDITLRRCIALTVCTLFAWWLAASLSWRQIIIAAAMAWAPLVAISFAVLVVWPEAGFMPAGQDYAGAWRGIWQHKNVAGIFMAHAVLVFLLAGLLQPYRQTIWYGMAVAATGFVAMTQSTTSLVAVAIIIAVFTMREFTKVGAGVAAAMIIAGVSVGGIAVSMLLLDPEMFFGLFGKDETLTGRTDIWGGVIAEINARPFTGYGHGAFWAGDTTAQHLRDAVGWDVPTAHSGWLEVALSLGWGGMALFASTTSMGLLRGLQGFSRPIVGIFATAILGMFLLFSITESVILREHSFQWILFVFVLSKLSQEH